VRDAIFLRLTSSQAPGEDASAARVAGVVAALVTGDQRAIDLEADIKVENWASL
jgi:competence protein ComEC